MARVRSRSATIHGGAGGVADAVRNRKPPPSAALIERRSGEGPSSAGRRRSSRQPKTCSAPDRHSRRGHPGEGETTAACIIGDHHGREAGDGEDRYRRFNAQRQSDYRRKRGQQKERGKGLHGECEDALNTRGGRKSCTARVSFREPTRATMRAICLHGRARWQGSRSSAGRGSATSAGPTADP